PETRAPSSSTGSPAPANTSVPPLPPPPPLELLPPPPQPAAAATRAAAPNSRATLSAIFLMWLLSGFPKNPPLQGRKLARVYGGASRVSCPGLFGRAISRL